MSTRGDAVEYEEGGGGQEEAKRVPSRMMLLPESVAQRGEGDAKDIGRIYTVDSVPSQYSREA